jgi:hypothetical protein
MFFRILNIFATLFVSQTTCLQRRQIEVTTPQCCTRRTPLSLLQLPSAKINIYLSLHRQTFSSCVKGDFIVGCFAEFSKYLLHLKPDGPHEAADDVEVV